SIGSCIERFAKKGPTRVPVSLDRCSRVRDHVAVDVPAVDAGRSGPVDEAALPDDGICRRERLERNDPAAATRERLVPLLRRDGRRDSMARPPFPSTTRPSLSTILPTIE